MSSPQSRGSSLSSSLRGETGASDEVGVVRHEEEASVRREEVEVGAVRARKNVETERVEQSVPRHVERVDELERAAANEGDSGEIEVLPDGSVSIPILEEELVVAKRTVVRERVIVRKRTETEQ
jgi:uncharacterized protein (TIGR02271 family)